MPRAIGERIARGFGAPNERTIVFRVVGRAAAQSGRQLEPGCRGALQEDAGRRIHALQPLERADERVDAVADAVAVEVEPSVAAPVVAAPIDFPARAGF